MRTNLLSLAEQALGADFSKLAAQYLDELQGATQSALTSLLPAVLGGIAHKGSTQDGASGLLSLINGTSLDVSSLGNLAGLFGGDGSGINSLLKLGTRSLVPALFGDKSDALVDALSSVSGIKSSAATKLVAMVVPLIMTLLRKIIGDQGLTANSLASLLGSQGSNLQGALDSRLTGALGFASPTAFLGGLGTQAATMAKHAGAAGATGATNAPNSGLLRWLPWLILAAALLFLWNM